MDINDEIEQKRVEELEWLKSLGPIGEVILKCREDGIGVRILDYNDTREVEERLARGTPE